MSQANLFPKNGALVYAGTVIGFNTFEIDEQQVVDDATPYGTNVMGVNVGNGTPTARLTFGGFALKGAAGTKLGLDGSAFTTPNAMATLTLDTGCTEAGLFVLRQLRAQHARMRATVPVMGEAMNAGDLTETWATGA